MPLNTPVLTIADSADGGNGTATVTGATTGTTNTLYRQSVDGELGGSTWTSTGSRTSSGTIPIALSAKGYFWWYVLSELAGESVVSNLVYQPLTDGDEAVLTRCIDAIAARLTLLNVTGIGTKIYSRTLPDDPVISYPCTLVCREPTPHQYRGGSNTRDDIGYPIQVLNMTSDSLRQNSPVERYDLWRQQQERAFREQRLPGVDECQWCEIEPLKILDDQAPAMFSKVVSGFTIRAVTREVRGFGA